MENPNRASNTFDNVDGSEQNKDNNKVLVTTRMKEASEKVPYDDADDDRVNDFAEEFPPDSPTVNLVPPTTTTVSPNHDDDDDDKKKKARQDKLEHARPAQVQQRQVSESVSVGNSHKNQWQLQSPKSTKRSTTTKTLQHAPPSSGPQLLPTQPPFEFDPHDAVPAHEKVSSHGTPASSAAATTLPLIDHPSFDNDDGMNNSRNSVVTNHSNYNYNFTTPGAYAVSTSGYFSSSSTATTTATTRSAPVGMQDVSLSETLTRISTTRADRTVNEESQLEEEEGDDGLTTAETYASSIAHNSMITNTTTGSAMHDTGYYAVEAHRVEDHKKVVFEAHRVNNDDTVVKWYKRPLYRLLLIGCVLLVVILVAVIATLVRPNTTTKTDSMLSPSSAPPDVGAASPPTTVAPTPWTPEQIACDFIRRESLTECAATLHVRRGTGLGGGSIPTEVGLLTQLTFLSLEGNELDGTIPSTIGSLSSLTYLSFRENLLTGSIPSSIGSLTKLQSLSFYMNGITGTIPSSVAALTQSTFLSFDSTYLTGKIPSSLCAHVSIVYTTCETSQCSCCRQENNACG